MKHSIPRRILKQAGMTARQWKQVKRFQAREAERVFGNFAFASAFTPGKIYVDKIRVLLAELRKSLKVKNWGN